MSLGGAWLAVALLGNTEPGLQVSAGSADLSGAWRWQARSASLRSTARERPADFSREEEEGVGFLFVGLLGG